MKKAVKEFFIRGLIFGGFGPIVYAVIMLILDLCNVDINLEGLTLFTAVISTYFMAFFIAGTSIIWEIDRLGLALAIPTHGGILYLCYFITYIVNGWISTNLEVIVTFTMIFIFGYAFIWLIIYLVEKNVAKKLNKSLR